MVIGAEKINVGKKYWLALNPPISVYCQSLCGLNYIFKDSFGVDYFYSNEDLYISVFDNELSAWHVLLDNKRPTITRYIKYMKGKIKEFNELKDGNENLEVCALLDDYIQKIENDITKLEQIA